MGSFEEPRVFDLEIVEQAYEAAWAEIVSRDPFRDPAQDNERKLFLRERVFAIACKVTDAAAFREKVLEDMAALWIPPVKTEKPPRRMRIA